MHFLPQLQSSLSIWNISDCVCWWWAINSKHVLQMIRERSQDPWNGFLNLMCSALRFSRPLPSRVGLQSEMHLGVVDLTDVCSNICLGKALLSKSCWIFVKWHYKSGPKLSEPFQWPSVLVITKFRRSDTSACTCCIVCKEFMCFTRMWGFFTNSWSSNTTWCHLLPEFWSKLLCVYVCTWMFCCCKNLTN